jgi:hypothetical protein
MAPNSHCPAVSSGAILCREELLETAVDAAAWGSRDVLFLLAGWSVLQNRTSNNRWDMEMIEWGEPPPSLIQRWWVKMGRVPFRLPEFWKQRRPEIALKPPPPETDTAPAELLKKPRQPVLPLFGAPNGRQKEGFAWDEHNGIE